MFGALALSLIAGCGGESAGELGTSPEATFPTSLHATGRGMITWYSSTSGGFEQSTGIAYPDLSCRSCHRPLCTNCHATPGDTVPQDSCLACHGLVAAEWAHYSDVHRASGMECMDCHSLREMHGDGTGYASLLAEGAMDTECANCHTPLASNPYHEVHGEAVDCSACHVQGVVTCHNCHLETELEHRQKKSYGEFTDWIFLVNYDGKVHAANFQSAKYRDKSFLAMAPFTAHAIAKQARTCDECHHNAAIEEYVATGKIQVTHWDAKTSQLTHIGGVIPVPQDWQAALKFDFADLAEDGNWVFMEAGPDTFQMLFGSPLTRAQMDKLKKVRSP